MTKKVDHTTNIQPVVTSIVTKKYIIQQTYNQYRYRYIMRKNFSWQECKIIMQLVLLFFLYLLNTLQGIILLAYSHCQSLDSGLRSANLS